MLFFARHVQLFKVSAIPHYICLGSVGNGGYHPLDGCTAGVAGRDSNKYWKDWVSWP